MFNLDPLSLMIRMVPVLFSLTLHEFMHGYVAYRCGDPTAKYAGRLTLNPIPHLDLFGTLMLMFGPIGWAKPVPINPNYFRVPRRDDILVSLAGVVSNFTLAALLCLVFRGLIAADYQPQSPVGNVLFIMLLLGIFINFALCFFNLLPIAPLDGHHVVRELLHGEARARFQEFSRYGPIILLGLVLLSRGFLFNFLWVPIRLFAVLFGGEELGDFLDRLLLGI